MVYYRPSTFGQIEIDGQQVTIPEEIIAHFRNVRAVGSVDSHIRVAVFDPVFQNRQTYLRAVLALLPAYAGESALSSFWTQTRGWNRRRRAWSTSLEQKSRYMGKHEIRRRIGVLPTPNEPCRSALDSAKARSDGSGTWGAPSVREDCQRRSNRSRCGAFLLTEVVTAANQLLHLTAAALRFSRVNGRSL